MDWEGGSCLMSGSFDIYQQLNEENKPNIEQLKNALWTTFMMVLNECS